MVTEHGPETVFIGAATQDPVDLLLRYANRHGLITGATGTGKTVTLQILTEAFSDAGIPVFLADVKGDLAGLATSGADKDFLQARADKIGFENYGPRSYPVTFWDIFGEKGHPVRTTLLEMGPLLLARLLGLNDTQEGVLTIAFRVSEEERLPLLDLDDLRSLLVYIGQERKRLSLAYGNIAPASVAAIQRRILQLEDQGGAHLFGEPALAPSDLMRLGPDGRGSVNILAADRLMMTPKLYATFLLWLLSELFEELPEVGDPDKPILVFFFDEAHLLFDDAPDILLDRIEQVARLIRSKGVGVFFVTQNPQDVPDTVSSQLGNRVQHALRAYTPKERKVVRVAAQSFRANPAFDAEEVITDLGVGEALVSTLRPKAVPSMVERTLIRPPQSRLGPLSDSERHAVLADSSLGRVYDQPVDRRSAHEILEEKALRAAEAAERAVELEEKAPRTTTRRRSTRMSPVEKATNQAIRTGTRTLVRELMRGLLGGLRRR